MFMPDLRKLMTFLNITSTSVSGKKFKKFNKIWRVHKYICDWAGPRQKSLRSREALRFFCQQRLAPPCTSFMCRHSHLLSTHSRASPRYVSSESENVIEGAGLNTVSMIAPRTCMLVCDVWGWPSQHPQFGVNFGRKRQAAAIALRSGRIDAVSPSPKMPAVSWSEWEHSLFVLGLAFLAYLLQRFTLSLAPKGLPLFFDKFDCSFDSWIDLVGSWHEGVDSSMTSVWISLSPRKNTIKYM